LSIKFPTSQDISSITSPDIIATDSAQILSEIFLLTYTIWTLNGKLYFAQFYFLSVKHT
jgi:hypothetical protein